MLNFQKEIVHLTSMENIFIKGNFSKFIDSKMTYMLLCINLLILLFKNKLSTMLLIIITKSTQMNGYHLLIPLILWLF